MVLRRATEVDMEQITALVRQVFTGEQGIPEDMHRIAPECTPIWWCAEADRRVVACAAVFCEEGEWHMGRIAVVSEMRGRGVGTAFLRHVLEEAFEMGMECVHLEARDATVRILTRMGAETKGAPFEFFGDMCTPICIRREKFIPA